MVPDDARAEDVRAWLQKANLDLLAAEHEMSMANLRADVVFHAQQAAEKSLKAFLAWHDFPFRKTHNIEELGRACVPFDDSLRSVVDQAVPLTEYAWKFRYPGEPGEPSQREAKEALTMARAVYEAILTRVSPKGRP